MQFDILVDPMNKLTEFEYTDSICGGCGAAQAQIALIRDHDDNETTFEYDSAGMLVRVENAAGQAVVNTYDTMHRLTQVTRENGPLVAAYTYDALNRVVATADGDGNAITYTYNFLGDLTAVTDAEGPTQLVVKRTPSETSTHARSTHVRFALARRKGRY